MLRLKIVLTTTLFIMILACNNKPQPIINSQVQIKNNGFKDTLEDINKILLQKDRERILAYKKRMAWDMQETQSGLWYSIVENNHSDKAKDNQIVKINYRTELLDGTIAYTTENSTPRQLKIGRTDSETGLQAGLKLMGEGDSAIFIAPPYMAKGLLGDFDKIPARAILVYKVRLLELPKENKSSNR